MLKIRASTHLLTEPDVCAKSSNPQLIAKHFSLASGINTACDRSMDFFCSTISFSNNNIDTKTYEIIFHLHFICNLLFKCQLKVITCFFSNGVGNSVLSHINCGNFLSFVRRNANWWRLPSRIYPNLKVTWLYFETEKTRSAMLSFKVAFIVYIYNFEDHASIAS